MSCWLRHIKMHDVSATVQCKLVVCIPSWAESRSAYHSTLMKESANTGRRSAFYLQSTLWLNQLLHRQEDNKTAIKLHYTLCSDGLYLLCVCRYPRWIACYCSIQSFISQLILFSECCWHFTVLHEPLSGIAVSMDGH